MINHASENALLPSGVVIGEESGAFTFVCVFTGVTTTVLQSIAICFRIERKGVRVILSIS